MKPELVITRFLREQFTDEQLTALRADAIAGKVPYQRWDRCLVGHSGLAGRFMPPFCVSMLSESVAPSNAYQSLGGSTIIVRRFLGRARADSRRMRRLIPLVDAEIERRIRARAEVAEYAKEQVNQPSSGAGSSLSLALEETGEGIHNRAPGLR